MLRLPIALCLFVSSAALTASAAAEPLQFGFAKVDLTPSRSLRLSGYGSRSEPLEGVDEKLYGRVMAVRSGDRTSLLISVDTIGFPGSLSKSIAERIEKEHGIPRSGVAVCCTHSHTAPHVAEGLTNIFTKALTEAERRNSKTYTEAMAKKLVEAAGEAIEDLKPGKLYWAVGEATFAHNRRALKDGKWVGFSGNPNGPVDHSLPVLKVVGEDGKVRGLAFNYACHCTTFGPRYNRVNGDWAGYAARQLEAEFPGATALCTIGCGADQNPTRDSDPEKALKLSKAHGAEIAAEVKRLASGEMKEITAPLETSYGFAGLPVERPTLEELREQLKSPRPQNRRHAENMLALHARMGRLPETYPAPVQVWRFGKQATMVFLGGEVVVDYARRIKKELKGELVWVTAYANDVFAYVASERMRAEGGYEVDGSMIYYNQPGRWASGTEEVLMRRVRELAEEGSFGGPYSPEESLERFHLSPGYKIGIVASEPLIRDPVNFAVAPDGKLWVVEMGDYPRGLDDEGEPGGRVRVLTDTDGDGRYDEARTFLDKLAFPTGVLPYKNGALISGAPALVYAEDSDGDGRADAVHPLYSGFEEANPQHRVAGFTRGLDNWLHLSSGTNNRTITSHKTDKTLDMSGRDLRIAPESGGMATTSGRSQYGRTRNDFGDWFANSNSRPLWHYAIDDRYLVRNPYFAAPSPQVHLMDPPLAPPVYPTSRTLDRFNDLFALNRFTSACSPTVFRDRTLGTDTRGNVFVCEPVHNLVHRAVLVRDGVTFRAERHPNEQESEFLSSTDHWFRPTSLAAGPDGALWVADMYRLVIEHPEWIPESWQARLNLRAGETRGRIYRVYKDEPAPIPDMTQLPEGALVGMLGHRNGWIRDQAQHLLIERGNREVVGELESVVQKHDEPLVRLHALCTLEGLGALSDAVVETALGDDHFAVRRRALVFAEGRFDAVHEAALALVDDEDVRVRFQLALSLGEWDDPRAGEALGRLAAKDAGETWMRAAVVSSSLHHGAAILKPLLRDVQPSRERSNLVEQLIATQLGASEGRGAAAVLGQIVPEENADVAAWQIGALASFLGALERHKLSLEKLRKGADDELSARLDAVGRVVEAARRIAADEDAEIEERATAVRLVGRQSDSLEFLAGLLSPRTPLSIQRAAIDALASTRDGSVPEVLLKNWRSHSPQVKSAILAVLTSRREWTEALLDAIENKNLSPGDVEAAYRTALTSHSRRSIRERARKLFGESADTERAAVVAQFADVADLAGNPLRGALVFSRTCATCHRFRGRGTDLGAKLSALKDKSDSALLVALLDPNRAVEAKYRSYLAATSDGRVRTGMIVAETTSSLTLADPNGKQETILRIDLEQLASTGKSFMPEGLEKDLSKQEVADVFAFIRSQPVPAAELTSERIGQHKSWAGSAGIANNVAAIKGGKEWTLETWLGEATLRSVGSASHGSRSMRWTATVSGADSDNAPLAVRLPVAVRHADGAKGTAFTLFLDGRDVATFRVAHGEGTLGQGESGVRLDYLAVATTPSGSSGVLDITVPQSLAQSGKPLEFQIDAPATGGADWLGIVVQR